MSTSTKAKKVTTMDKAMKIFQAAFAKPLKDKTARQTAISNFQTKLGMQTTTAATYFSHCMKKVREIEHEAVEQSKRVPWAAVKVDGNGAVTSYGHFLTKAGAAAFNAQYEHDGVLRGKVEQGQSLDVSKLKTA